MNKKEKGIVPLRWELESVSEDQLYESLQTLFGWGDSVRNLDALWDALRFEKRTLIVHPARILLERWGGYGQEVLNVLGDWQEDGGELFLRW